MATCAVVSNQGEVQWTYTVANSLCFHLGWHTPPFDPIVFPHFTIIIFVSNINCVLYTTSVTNKQMY